MFEPRGELTEQRGPFLFYRDMSSPFLESGRCCCMTFRLCVS